MFEKDQTAHTTSYTQRTHVTDLTQTPGLCATPQPISTALPDM